MVKKACEPRLRILKMIGAKLPRGDRKSLLQVGSALVTAKLVYGIGVVSRGGPATLQSLAPAYNTMVRYASGAFVTSPIASIMAEAGTLPFDLLAVQTVTRIAIRILTKNRNNSSLPLVRRASDRLNELTNSALPAVGQIVRQTNRPWHVRKPSIVWDVKKQVRAGDPPEKVRPIVQQLLSTRFHRSTVIYTDGSKHESTVAAAFHSNGLAGKYCLPKECSVFSAEAYAIKMAVSIPNLSNDLVVLTDSASCLQALEAGASKHPWIQEVEQLTRNKSVRFCWIPGHAGIHGNNEADRLANEARAQSPMVIPIPGDDVLRMVKEKIRQRWNEQWYASTDFKLREIKDDTHKWIERGSTFDQRVLTRLRIGHTRLTHTFLLKKEAPPNCCGTVLDVRHVILHCRNYESQRQENGINNGSLYEALGNSEENTTNLLNFLRQTGLYRKI